MTEQKTGFKTVEKWLTRLAPTTARTSMVFVRKFMRWLKENGGQFSEYTPDELVVYQKEAENSQQYDILDLVQGYVGQLDLREGSKQREYSGLRGLFAHNRAILPKDPTFRVRSRHAPVEGTLKVEEIRDMILGSNKVYRAVFLCMFQGGMGLDEFDYWNRNGWSKLREDLREDPDIIKIDFPGRRKLRRMRPFYTLIGPDAIKVLREWIVIRPKDAEAIFTNQYGAPIHLHSARLYWLRHLEKLGFIQRKRNGEKSNRYGKAPHEMRDVFRSQWEKSPAKGSVAEFMMGHIVDPLFYNKACRDEDWVRKMYRQALPLLQIMSSGRPFGQVSEDTLESLQAEVARLRAGKDSEVNALRQEMEDLKRMFFENLKSETD